MELVGRTDSATVSNSGSRLGSGSEQIMELEAEKEFIPEVAGDNAVDLCEEDCIEDSLAVGEETSDGVERPTCRLNNFGKRK